MQTVTGREQASVFLITGARGRLTGRGKKVSAFYQLF